MQQFQITKGYNLAVKNRGQQLFTVVLIACQCICYQDLMRTVARRSGRQLSSIDRRLLCHLLDTDIDQHMLSAGPERLQATLQPLQRPAALTGQGIARGFARD